MANVKKESGSSLGGLFSGIVIVACIAIGWVIWQFIMGNGANFEGGVNTGAPLKGNYLAMVYKGGHRSCFDGTIADGGSFLNRKILRNHQSDRKRKLGQFMKNVQASIKEDILMKPLQHVTNNKVL
jgi:biopolymer transport protein ExbB